MFACLYLPPPASRGPAFAKATASAAQEIVQLARDFSPRVEPHGDRLVTLDVRGLGSLLGDARAIGEELRRTAADRGVRVHVAIAATTTAAILLAQSRAGLVVIPAGEEAQALAPLPLSALEGMDSALAPDFAQLRRWGLRTLGDLAALPPGDLSERLGQTGLLWQRWARGQEARPLVPAGVEDTFEEALDLEWPIEGLEPLSFVLARLCDPLCERLEERDRGAVALHVTLTLVDKQQHARSLQLPAPMRDARVLRTLALLDLESHPPASAIDRVCVRVDVTEGRVLQFGLFARALPTERLATLTARLGALMGEQHVGAPALVDSYRPGAFAMAKFEPSATSPKTSEHKTDKPNYVLRRFRSPIPARVTLAQGRPARVTTDRRGVAGGAVERCDGPWRSSGEWWRHSAPATPWSCDEWDVTLGDGVSYRISRTDIAEREPSRTEREVAARRAGASRDLLKKEDAWFVDGILD